MRMTVSGFWKLSAEPAEITVNANDEAHARRYAETTGIVVMSVRPAAGRTPEAPRRPDAAPAPLVSPQPER